MAEEQQELERWLHGMLQKFVASYIGDPGEVVKVAVDRLDDDGGAVADVDDDRRWVSVSMRGVVDSKRRWLGRLLSPGGLVWWLPERDEVGAMLRAGNLGGALTTYFLGGHGGAANRVPAWLSSTVVGIYARAGKALRLDAEDGDVQVTGGGKVKLQGGGRKAAGKDHAVKVTIPINTVVVGVTGGGGSPAVAVMNASPIELTGTITEGSSKVEIDT